MTSDRKKKLNSGGNPVCFMNELSERDTTILVVPEIYDCEVSEQPFGERYAQQRIQLSSEELAALNRGEILAIDVQNEYVVYLEAGSLKKEEG